MVQRPFASPLVMLPGTLCDARVFAPLLAALRRQHGLQHLDAMVVQSAHCGTVRAAAEHVLTVAPPRFSLLGFSLGGIVALELALLAPERLVSLVLLNVNAAPAPSDLHTARRNAVLQARAVGAGRYVQQELWMNYVGPASRENDDLKHVLTSMAEESEQDAFHHQTEAALTRRDYRPLLAHIQTPTLVLAGEQDTICPATAQFEVAEAIPNAQFARIADAGHFALLERQDAVASSVAAWFHQLSDSAA